MTLYRCLACKADVLNFQDQTPRSCKKCGAGSAWMKAIKGDAVGVVEVVEVDGKTKAGGSDE